MSYTFDRTKEFVTTKTCVYVCMCTYGIICRENDVFSLLTDLDNILEINSLIN